VPNLTFTGFVPNADLPRWQAAADVLVMPYGRSISGSSGGDTAAVASPMKMFEYMAAGRAILSSDLPVIREVLTESMCAFAPPDDAAAWQAALGALLADPEKRRALGRAARAEVEKYTWLARTQALLRGFPKNQP
jgi:glycosyltransferase involved in cell wall biosynthesis